MPSEILGRGRQASLARVLAAENAFASSLLAIVVDQYGIEAISGPEAWHPETLRRELEQDFGVELPTINGDKLFAAIDILTSDRFFKQVTTFVTCCNVLSGSHPDFWSFDKAEVDEVAWGLTEGLLIAAPDEDEPFSDEVRYYVGKITRDEGIKTPPDVLKIGLWDEDFSGYPEDPAGFSDAFKLQADESAEISQWLRQRLFALVDELQSLVLQHGDTSGLVERLARGLQA